MEIISIIIVFISSASAGIGLTWCGARTIRLVVDEDTVNSENSNIANHDGEKDYDDDDELSAIPVYPNEIIEKIRKASLEDTERTHASECANSLISDVDNYKELRRENSTETHENTLFNKFISLKSKSMDDSILKSDSRDNSMNKRNMKKVSFQSDDELRVFQAVTT